MAAPARRDLPVAVPEPVAVGAPGLGYPYPWAVQRWIPGRGAAPDTIDDPVAFARDLAEVVRSLQRVSVEGAPEPHNRARPLQAYDRATRAAIERAGHLVDAGAALAVWEDALAAPPTKVPRLGPRRPRGQLPRPRRAPLRDRRLGFGLPGRPAVDVQVVWSPLFTDESRRIFLDELEVDDATVRRSRGAAINQACAALPYYLRTYPLIVGAVVAQAGRPRRGRRRPVLTRVPTVRSVVSGMDP